MEIVSKAALIKFLTRQDPFLFHKFPKNQLQTLMNGK
jgi:hypothetical protein